MKFSEQSTRKEEAMQKVPPEIRIGVLLNLLVNNKLHICRMKLHEATQRTTGSAVQSIQLLHGSKEISKTFYEKTSHVDLCSSNLCCARVNCMSFST